MIAAEPQRIVSLVPSLTESLFVLGLGDRVVGVTDFCIHPVEEVAELPKVGGPKNPDVKVIVSLDPDLVIANHEENTRSSVEQMRSAGLSVWVTYPRTVRDATLLFRQLAALGASSEAIRRHVAPLEQALAETESAPSRRRVRVFCPIWRDPWMSIGRDTYAHDLLRLCGGENVFGDLRDQRYPKVTLADVEAVDPEVVLLPDEPYPFGVMEAEEIAALDTEASRWGRIHLIDGTLVSWYGPRIQRALARIRPLLQGDS